MAGTNCYVSCGIERKRIMGIEEELVVRRYKVAHNLAGVAADSGGWQRQGPGVYSDTQLISANR